MCEMLVRLVDKINREDPHLDAKCLKRGDVVVICEDGWPWSNRELKNPAWRVLYFPYLSVEKAQAFLGPEIDEGPKNPSKVLRRRAFKIDLDSALLPTEVKQAMQDGARVKTRIAVQLSELDALALKVGKPRLEDPSVFEPVEPGGKP